jgi:hypothetical protein
MKKFIMAVLLSLTLTGCGLNHDPGIGQKTGTIIALHKGGIFQETWEAELIKGGMNGGSGAFGVEPFWFTIEDDALAATVQDYMDKQTEIIIHYRREGFYSAFRTDSGGDFLITVEPTTNSVPAEHSRKGVRL